MNCFPPDGWIFDRISGKAIPLDSLRPCECGGTEFTWVFRSTGLPGGLFCSACYDDKRFKMAKRGDVPYATIDARTGEATYQRAGLDRVEAMRRKADETQIGEEMR